jgi:putative redox protein
MAARDASRKPRPQLAANNSDCSDTVGRSRPRSVAAVNGTRLTTSLYGLTESGKARHFSQVTPPGARRPLPEPLASGAAQFNDPPHEEDIMECTIRWTGEGMSFIAETGSGHMVAMDGAPEGGGRNLAPRPMEMVLLGTGGCTAYDVVLILKRGRHDVRGCDVRLLADRAAEDPKVFTRIEFRFTVRGKGLKRDIVERAVRLSHEKYCSASAMLARTAAIETSIEVVEAD